MSEKERDTRKRVFISFAIEDVEYRNHLVNQARREKSPFDFIDMSVKKAWKPQEWKDKCRTKIKRCHGVIVLLSNNTYHSSGARYEIKCAKIDRIPIVGMHIKKNEQYAPPPELKGKKIIVWTWPNIEKFINSL